jgi:hypothetical protein
MLHCPTDGLRTSIRISLVADIPQLTGLLKIYRDFVALVSVNHHLLAKYFTIFVIIAWLSISREFFGQATTLVIVLFLGGVQLISLGILGEYLGPIYDKVKERPLYIVSETYGFSDGQKHSEANIVDVSSYHKVRNPQTLDPTVNQAEGLGTENKDLLGQ